MEFITVYFPEVREVIGDDVASGQQSGNVIELEAGHHAISSSGEF